MKNFKNDNMEIQFESGDLNRLIWTGKSINRDPSEELNPYLDEILEHLKGKKLEVDFSNLEYMNSSTVPPIIYMAKKLNQNNIETDIFYNCSSSWQSASFKALETIVLKMDSIKVKGKKY